MENKDNINEFEEELEQVSPSLARFIQKKKPDDIPFRYFDKLPDRVLAQIQIHDGKQSSWWDQLLGVFSTRKSLVWAFASMAGLILVAGIFLYRPSSNEWDLSKLDVEDVRTYLLSQASDLEDEQLSMLHTNESKMEMMHLSNEDLRPVLDEYLDQINIEDLN